MSIPIHRCIITKAAKGDEAAYQWLIDAMRINLACGHYSTLGCSCLPETENATDEQIKNLQTRMDEYFKANPVKSKLSKAVKIQRSKGEG